MKALLALAALAVTAALLRKRHAASLRSHESDDSDAVMVPMTWVAEQDNARTLGPGWYVELAPTSRN